MFEFRYLLAIVAIVLAFVLLALDPVEARPRLFSRGNTCSGPGCASQPQLTLVEAAVNAEPEPELVPMNNDVLGVVEAPALGPSDRGFNNEALAQGPVVTALGASGHKTVQAARTVVRLPAKAARGVAQARPLRRVGRVLSRPFRR
jgi:hypothetical protein